MYTIIFDFDGVIADTFWMVMEIGSQLVKELGGKNLTPSELADLKNKGSREIFSDLGVPIIKLPIWVKRVREEQAKNIERAPLFKGIKKLLLGLKKNGFRLGILTSNSLENVKKFFNKNHLSFSLFDFVHTESSLFGKDRILKKLFKKYKLDPRKVIYVGDEVRDIEAAKKVEIKMMAVGWGYNSKKALMAQKPDYFVEKPEEILEILSSKTLLMAKDYLGKEVEVVIDRPLGSKHPKHGFIYRANYGYVPGTKMPDGGGLDAYFLGVDRPIKQGKGRCIAIVHRLEDDDDKLVIVPPGKEGMSDKEIEKTVHFQEQWFKHKIVRD